jgi:proprotein convertase subtilisin/kexin type 5
MKGTICANPCGNGWYASSASVCSQCMSVCATCSSGTTCDTCKPGYVGASCSPCTSPCLTCSGTTTFCTACTPGSSYYLQLGGGSCVASSSCTAGSYAETNNQCMACSSECATCVDYPDKCLTCSDSTKVWENYKCIAGCATGYVSISGICCPNTCTGCSISGACSGCITGYYLDSSNSCQACSSNCQTCSGSSTKCLTCPSGKVLQGTVCQSSCNQKYYDVSSVCQSCHTSCKNCHGSADTDCDGCENLYVPWKGKCWSCMNNQTNFESSRFEEKGGKCWEKCGVSGKLSLDDIPEGLGGYKACDDGNLVNGDGCSASCTIEKNYNCIGGS